MNTKRTEYFYMFNYNIGTRGMFVFVLKDGHGSNTKVFFSFCISIPSRDVLYFFSSVYFSIIIREMAEKQTVGQYENRHC